MEIVVRDGRIELPASSMSMKRSTTELIARGSGNISYSRPFWYRASMSEILLYPTETLYALGVNALDSNALEVRSKEEIIQRPRVGSFVRLMTYTNMQR